MQGTDLCLQQEVQGMSMQRQRLMIPFQVITHRVRGIAAKHAHDNLQWSEQQYLLSCNVSRHSHDLTYLQPCQPQNETLTF